MKKLIQVLVLSSSIFILGCGGGKSDSGTTDPTLPVTPTDPTTPVTPTDPTTPVTPTDPTTPVTPTDPAPPVTPTDPTPPVTPPDPTPPVTPTDPGGTDTGAVSTENNNVVLTYNDTNDKIVENDTTSDKLAILAEQIALEQNQEQETTKAINDIAINENDKKIITEDQNQLDKEIKNFTPVSQGGLMPGMPGYEDYSKMQQEMQQNMMKQQQKYAEQQQKEFNLLSNISYKVIDLSNSKRQILKLTDMPLEAIPCDNAMIASYTSKDSQERNLFELMDFRDYGKINYNGWFFISADTVLTDNPMDTNTIFFDNELFIARFLSEKEIVMEPTKELFESKPVEFKKVSYPVVKLSSIKLVFMNNDIDYDCKEHIYQPQKPMSNN